MPKDSSHGASKAGNRSVRLTAAGAFTVVMLALSIAPPPAHALAYRCERPAGAAGQAPEVHYQGHACDGGRALRHADDHRTDAQRTDTAKATQANAKLGRQLERERHRQEKQGAGRRPIAMDKAKPPVALGANSTQGPTLKRERPFTAKVPKASPASQGKSD